MRLIKIILLVTGIIFVAIQFIQPAQNINKQVTATDISKVISIPDTVQVILQKACYDCHSNSTNYPWYYKVQPIRWLLAKHISRGKNELNFSEFATYSQRRQLSKLDAIANAIKDNNMPLPSYKMMHKNAQLSTNEKTLFINWAQQSKVKLSGIN